MKGSSFLQGNIFKSMIQFAIPLMLSLILQTLYGAVDLAVVGQYCTPASVSAVATGSQMFNAMTILISGFTMGITVLIGKAMGAGKKENISLIVNAQIKLFAILVVCLMAFVLGFRKQIVALMQVPQVAVDKTYAYLTICGLGMVFVASYNGISGIFRGLGNSTAPFIFVLIACICNIILDLVFVALFKMDVTGAALATVIAQGLSVVFSVFYMKKKKPPFTLSLQKIKEAKMLKSIVKIGAPISFQDFLISISFLIITSIINSMGVVASAAIGVAEKVFVFVSLIPMSFMSTLAAFVSQNMGANQKERADKALKIAMCICMVAGVIVFYFTHFRGELLASIFIKDNDVIMAAKNNMRGSSYEHLFIAISFCFLGYFNGTGRTVFVMIQGLLSAFLVRIPLSFYFSKLPNASLYSLGLAVSISALVSLVLCTTYYIYISGTRANKKGSKHK